ncbi:MAG: protein-glutamate O-methyltransferase CheR [Actinomycetia bacterium]|nr:protein-glutamate O-methyltransferase CheR [Actinomycetes bacterium]
MSTTETSEAINEKDLDYFCKLVNQEIGVQLGDKAYLIESRLQPLLQDFDIATISELISKMRLGDRKVQAAAIEAMTTNETSFFRDQHPFETLAKHLIPGLLDKTGGRLTIWNGACSSGQESYTLAMTLRDHFPQLCSSGRARIISTDVSPAMVARTQAGSYSRFELNRGLPTNDAIKHFDQSGRRWVAKEELRNMVEAREMNLLNPWLSIPKCDLVLLRNVLIYFTVDVKRDILRRIRTEVLAPHGCLLLGASESTVSLDSEYESRRVDNSAFQFIKGASS